MEANGWIFTEDIVSKNYNFADTCKASQNSQTSETWYGYNDYGDIGSASKNLKGKGSGILIYSNCFEDRHDEPDNWVKVYINEALISQATSGEVKEINFDYEENDVIKIEEGWAIIKIHQMGLDCGDDKLWPEEEPGKVCDSHQQGPYTDQLGCQEACESNNWCLGVDRTHKFEIWDSCFLCHDDKLVPAVNDFGFYRRPNMPKTTEASTTTTNRKTTEKPRTTERKTTIEPTTSARKTTTDFTTTAWKTTQEVTTTDRQSTEVKTTSEDVTTPYYTTTATHNPYRCMDIAVDQCSDEALDIIDTIQLDTLGDCHTFCDVVFKDICNSFIYYSETKMCTILEDHYFYLYGCKILGASHDTVLNCLQDDIRYADECKKMVESDCVFDGNVILTEKGIAEPEECYQLNELSNGKYYVYEDDSQTCTVFDSSARNCKIQRGVNDVKPSDCPA